MRFNSGNWQKCGGIGKNGERCLVLSLSDDFGNQWHRLLDKMIEIIGRRFGARVGGPSFASGVTYVARFNDHPETTLEEVNEVWDETTSGAEGNQVDNPGVPVPPGEDNSSGLCTA